MNESFIKEKPEWLSSEECAEWLGVELKTLWEWRKRQSIELPYYQLGERTFKYLKQDVIDYINKRRVSLEDRNVKHNEES